ncbi:hypothetical protein N0V90_005694 [Kalmusia sp. IMI 367209]|nr:hypothetical protein N0V90_005694 [Kalmusia sp. IMI 367209]
MSCPDCFRGGKAVGDPKGTIQTIYGTPTYVAEPPSTSASRSTIIIYTDGFGLGIVNSKVLADAYASLTGMRVLVPDIIPGGPMPHTVMDTMDTIMEPVALLNIIGQIKKGHRSVKADLPAGGKLGLAGFCWGGFLSINLSTKAAVEGGEERLVDAAFAAHPSSLSLPDNIVDAVKFKTPLAIAHAEKDVALSTLKMEETEAVLKQRVGDGHGEGEHNYQIKIYKGVGHGFAVRAKPGSEIEAKSADEAKEQAAEWFKRWL